MKKIIGILVLLLVLEIGYSQTQPTDLYGTWVLETHKLNDGTECADFNKINLTFKSDMTYVRNSNGYLTTGQWMIQNNQIKYYNSSLQNPNDGKVADHNYDFEIIGKKLFHTETVCSELRGESTYLKK